MRPPFFFALLEEMVESERIVRIVELLWPTGA